MIQMHVSSSASAWVHRLQIGGGSKNYNRIKLWRAQWAVCVYAAYIRGSARNDRMHRPWLKRWPLGLTVIPCGRVRCSQLECTYQFVHSFNRFAFVLFSFSHFSRRMFPTLRVSFSGPLRLVQPVDRYAVLLDIVSIDNRRYRYAYHRSSWLVAGKADPPPPARLYAHPDSPISADVLRKQVVSFEKVKLTNNELDKNGQVSVQPAKLLYFYYFLFRGNYWGKDTRS